MATNVTWNNTAYSVPNAGELNWASLTNFLVAIGNNAQTTITQRVAMRVATTTPVTVSASADCLVVTKLTIPAAVTVNLPAGTTGQYFAIIDGTGDASTNNVTVTPAAGTINGAATYVLNKNRAGVILAYNGSEWTILAEFAASSSGSDVLTTNNTKTVTNKTIVVANNTVTTAASGNLGATELNAALAELQTDIDTRATSAALTAHTSDTNNPHATTKTQVGLGNVDNTSDATKNAAAVTLTNKTLTSPVINSPTGIVKGDVGLGNVDNTSDATKNAAAVTLSNKTINNTNAITVKDSSFTLQDPSDATKQAQFNLSQISAGSLRSMTLPNSNQTLVGTTAAQVLTLKDYDGGTATNTSRITVPQANKSVLDALTRKEGTVVYATDLDALYIDDGTNLKAIGSGSGSGEVNAVLNPSADGALTGYTAGTSHAVSRITSGSPLSPVTSTAIRITATANAVESSASGGIYTVTTMPVGLRNKKLKVEFYFTSPTADTWALSVYGGSRMPLSTDASGVTTIPANTTGKYTTTFDTDSSTSYTVNLTRTAGSGTTTFDFTALIVGPGIQPQGAVAGEWQSFTMTVEGSTSNPTKNGSAPVDSARYRRVGDSMEITYSYVQSSAGSAGSGTYLFRIPGGLTIDTTKQNVSSSFLYAVGGSGYVWNGTAECSVVPAAYSSTQLCLNYFSSATAVGLVGSTNNSYGNANLRMTWTARVPIAEWAGSGTVNVAQNDVEYVYNSSSTTTTDTSSFATGVGGVAIAAFAPSGTTAVAKRVRFSTPAQAGDIIAVYIISPVGSGVSYIEMANFGFGYSENDAGTTAYGMWVSPVNGSLTDFNVNFQSKPSPSAGAWSTFSTFKWVAVKSRPGQAIGFGNATSVSAGLASPTGNLLDTHISASAAIQGSKVNLATNSVQGTVNYYLQSTFTPTLTTTGTNFTSVTYSVQQGNFTRIGNIVCFTIRVTWTAAAGSPTGALSIGNLPHAALNITQFAVQTDNVDYPNLTLGVIGSISSGSTVIQMIANRDLASSTSLDPAQNSGSATRTIFVSGSYVV